MNLRDIWNWLPTFRVVAETEHLPTAAEKLHVTPAALSRTIRLLEERLEQPLFNRSGRKLVLNHNGEKLLEFVQSGMANLQRGVDVVTEDRFSGSLRIACLGVLTNYYVLPGLVEMTDEYPDLDPTVKNMRTRDAMEALVQGHIDLAFVYEHMTFEGLEIVRLGESASSIYCGRGHPLFEKDDVEMDELLEHPFSVPGLGDTGVVMDGWPADVPRKIGMRITLLSSNLEVCKSGQFLTVLPDVAAEPFVETGRFRRFPFDVVPPAELFAAHRETEAKNGVVRTAIDCVRSQIK